MPYSGRGGGGYDDGGGGGSGGYADPDMMNRMRVLEDRLVGSEKSNRALLEEVVRLQSDYKVKGQYQAKPCFNVYWILHVCMSHTDSAVI